ncbi:MAG: FG-GAP repeat protein, partial [bacterium]
MRMNRLQRLVGRVIAGFVAALAVSAPLARAQELRPEDFKITCPHGSPGDEAGRSVAIRGDVAVVGADLDDDNGYQSGSACVYRRNGSEWGHETTLLAPDGNEIDLFGYSVAISDDGTRIVVGASGDETGSAYMFHWDGQN